MSLILQFTGEAAQAKVVGVLIGQEPEEDLSKAWGADLVHIWEVAGAVDPTVPERL